MSIRNLSIDRQTDFIDEQEVLQRMRDSQPEIDELIDNRLQKFRNGFFDIHGVVSKVAGRYFPGVSFYVISNTFKKIKGCSIKDYVRRRFEQRDEQRRLGFGVGNLELTEITYSPD